MSSRIADSKTRIGYNCIEGNNCAGVNRIFITPRAIRESSTDQYTPRAEKSGGRIEAGIFIRRTAANTKVFISALGHDVVT